MATDGTTRLLMIDDDPDDYQLTRELLADLPGDRFELDWAGDFDSGLAALLRGEHDAYLIDFRLGKQTGLDLLGKAVEQGCDAPLIFVTGEGDRELGLLALKAGAADYLVKGQFDATLLERSIRYALQRKQYTRELERRVRERTADLEATNAELRASEEFCRTALESSPDCVKVLDPDGCFLSMNANGMCLMEIEDFASFKGKPWPASLPADSQDRAQCAVSVARGGGTDHFTAFCPTAKGTPKWWDVTVSPVRQGDGPVNLILSVSRDITERRKTERAAALLAAIVASSDDAIISKDLDGVITSWNGGAQRLFGYTSGEAIGKPITMLIPAEHRDEEPQILERIRRGEAIENYETTRCRKDGTRLDIALTVSPLRDVNGKIVGASKIARDITERRKLERKLVEQAECIASESRRKDEFLAMLSHELRNPLAPIRSAVHLMRLRDHGGGDLIAQQARDIIERQVSNLTKIVSDLLEVSRVVNGRIRLEQQDIDLNQIIGHAVETVAPLFEQRRHEVAVHPCPDPLWISADATRIEEVLVNLLTNAAKYTLDSGRIDVWCERGAHFAQVRVRDNGVGITDEMLKDGRIFDLFSQADRSLARSAGGLGIGLSLANRLVEMHGGTIEAHSPPQGASAGSEFIVRLPLMAVPPQIAAPHEPEPVGHSGGLRILVVDDNLDQVMMLSTVLRHRGYSVQSAYTGQEGLNMARLSRPDVVLLDIGLPGLDGYEVARRIRAEVPSDQKRVRLVALTGYGRESDVTLAREAGFDGHLTKPASLEDIEKMIASFQR